MAIEIMSLREKLGDRPVMMEVIPPSRRAKEKFVVRFIDSYVQKALNTCEIDAVNIPEIVEENYRGRPLYKNMDPREFSRVLRSICGHRDVVVNKIVVHCRSGLDELAEWAFVTTEDYGVHNVVAVGGNSSRHRYPGPTVLEANRMMRDTGLLCGNIMIPERRDEARRMLMKTRAGADFFTTQAIFSSSRLLEVLRTYDSLCKRRDLDHATVFLSFTPVSDQNDLDFLHWLGVEIDSETERGLLAGESKDLARPSIDLALANWRRVLSESRSYGGIPLGLNIEYVTRHNFDDALEMGKRLIEEG